MKKIMALAAAALMAVASVSAQENFIGGRGILQFSVGSELGDDFNGSGIEEAVEMSGGAVFFVRSVYESGFALQAEFGYTKNIMGLENKEVSESGTLSCDTFNVGVLFGKEIAMSEKMTLTPFVGVQSGIIVGKAEFEANGISAKGDVDSTAVISVVLGAGAAIKTDSGAVVIDGRYNYGINPIEVEGVEFCTFRSLAISAGYQIKL